MCDIMERYIDEGREEGRAEGREEGRKEGRAEGREEGKHVGREIERDTAIKRLLDAKMTIDFIKSLGYTDDEINRALNRLKED